MGNSRKSPRLNKTADAVAARFKRALEAILARVVVSDDAIALAYSGGLDSALLLRLLADHGQRSGRRVFAFHVHHGLSPNADDWLAHCARQAAALGVTFDSARVAVSDHGGLGIEQAARNARYRALGELCNRHQVSLLLTAHHQDDQAESVLLQLFRGAGLPGLSGMADAVDAYALLGHPIALGRPLLDCRRRELEQAAATLSVAHVDDESNADVRYRRNAIRQEIMPLVERHFPGAGGAIARSSRHWQAARQLQDELAAIDLAHCAHGEALSLERMAALSVTRVDNLLRYWLAGQGAQRPPSEAQLMQLREQVLGAASDAHPTLPLCGLKLQRQRGLLLALPCSNLQPPDGELCLRWQGEPSIEVPEWQGALLFERGAGGIGDEQLRRGMLKLRPRAGGERLKPDGRRPSRSLKNLYQEAGLAAALRPWLPLVYLDDALVFAAGLAMDARHTGAAGGIRLRWQPGSAADVPDR